MSARSDHDGVVPASRAHALRRGGGLAAWSIRHPVGVVMMSVAVLVLGALSLGRLGVDLLPHIIYPEVSVRVIDPGVPARIMEDQITRQLEEQLAITEDAISVQSRTSEGRTAVDLSFGYGKDIDVALRDASTRLDRAKRFLPDTIDPPIIFKRDPSQIPVTEYVLSSPLREPVELRDWVDYVLGKWFITLPGVASVEVGGGPLREILVEPDQQRLAGHGLSVDDVIDAVERGNRESPGGPLRMARREITGRTSGRFATVEDIAAQPIEVTGSQGEARVVRLGDVAEVIDGVEEEKLRVRLDGVPGVKIAMQKQPQANTVAVADAVSERLDWLHAQRLIPADMRIDKISDQAVYVRHALANATGAAFSGGLLAMLVVYLFLGDVRRTLIIGSGIPIAIMVALMLMDVAGLTLNIMTLGGLALGVGLLVDNTIVMLENIYRHQRMGEGRFEAPTAAAAEVNAAIVASTTTNLAAVLPFLFIGGLVGLLFRELIATISSAMAASLLVAVTLVPTLAARVPTVRSTGHFRRAIDAVMSAAQRAYARALGVVLRYAVLVPVAFAFGLWVSLPVFQTGKETFLPEIDDGRIRAHMVADAGISLDEMDQGVARVERLFMAQPEVESVFVQSGGFVFGRSQYEATNRARLSVQLVPLARRDVSTVEWIARMTRGVAKLRLAGVKVRMRTQGIRGIRIGAGDDSLSLRVQGPELETLSGLGERLVARLRDVEGLSNVNHSLEDVRQELSVVVDRDGAASLGLDVEEVGRAVRIALQGIVVTDYIEGDRRYDIRVRLPRREVSSPGDLERILLFPGTEHRSPVLLGHVAEVELVSSPASVRRDRQQRVVEVGGSVRGERTLGEVTRDVESRLAGFELPEGYTMYDGGAADILKQGRSLGQILLALALFLVFVVMAVQYESLLNPLLILLSVPFAAIGVAIGVAALDFPLSMPLWLGMVMLAGIVVNNAIVLVEYIELARGRGAGVHEAIIEAGRLRLRPILMTTLTTVAGMTPLALGFGEGAEMLRPLAVTIVFGLSFSTVVSLLLVPALYRLMHREHPRLEPAAA
jgi:multidrug efflux pump subunit AcrB